MPCMSPTLLFYLEPELEGARGRSETVRVPAPSASDFPVLLRIENTLSPFICAP